MSTSWSSMASPCVWSSRPARSRTATAATPSPAWKTRSSASTGCAIATHLAVPSVHRFVTPLVYAVPVQLIAYYTATFMGTDVDQPRNLAKSVTVE